MKTNLLGQRSGVYLFIILLVSAAVPTSTAEDDTILGEYHGSILIGHGKPGAIRGIDWDEVVAPEGSIGFNLIGDVRYFWSTMASDVVWHRVEIYGPLGTVDESFTLQWIGPGGNPDVPLRHLMEEGPWHGTNCEDDFCLT